ncbi:BglG family transcription antiterminator [Lactovum odontotermitis]
MYAEQEKTLFSILLQSQVHLPAAFLASQLNVSTKTIYRLIKKINDENKEVIITSEKSKGIRIDYEKYQKKYAGPLEIFYDYSPMERRDLVMEKLLLRAPQETNVYELFKDFYIGETTITRDQQIIEKRLKVFDLTLCRKNRILSIQGSEVNIRQAIAELIQRLNTFDLNELKNPKKSRLNSYDVLFVLRQMRELERELESSIPYPYNINIFTHLYILLNRARKVNLLQRSESQELSDDNIKELHKNPTLFHVAEHIIINTENYLFQKLPEIETYYLFQYLSSSRFQGAISLPISFPAEVSEITNAYLERLSKTLNIKSFESASFMDLANHIKPMLNRLRHGITVKNGLLEQIRMIYPEIFQQVSIVSEEISEKYHLPRINSDEAGFISLYFAKVVETQIKEIKTLIVCTTGIGTSELLRTKVKNKFPELIIVDVLSTSDLKKYLAQAQDIQFVLTTVQLPGMPPTLETLLVSAILTENDQKNIREKIGEMTAG